MNVTHKIFYFQLIWKIFIWSSLFLGWFSSLPPPSNHKISLRENFSDELEPKHFLGNVYLARERCPKNFRILAHRKFFHLEFTFFGNFSLFFQISIFFFKNQNWKCHNSFLRKYFSILIFFWLPKRFSHRFRVSIWCFSISEVFKFFL